MRILFAGNKARGPGCLEALLRRGHRILAAIVPPGDDPGDQGTMAAAAVRRGLPLFQPRDVNHPTFLEQVRALSPEACVLAGYGQIVRWPFLDLAPFGCLNLHGGKLPEFRGSSPMNWALLRGEREFGLSVIRVDEGVDTGDVLVERIHPIGPDDTIADLHRIAQGAFPEMLAEALDALERGTARPRKQDESRAAYYPLRFPDDGLVLWDVLAAEEVHNRIRALTTPYPGAFTYLGPRRVTLLESRRTKGVYHGEPGRVYRKDGNGLLVAARDRCLWVRRAVFRDDGSDALPDVERYQSFATVCGLARTVLEGGR